MLKGYNLKPLFFLMGPPMIGILYALVSLTHSKEALGLNGPYTKKSKK